jgi:hypothetical protein
LRHFLLARNVAVDWDKEKVATAAVINASAAFEPPSGGNSTGWHLVDVFSGDPWHLSCQVSGKLWTLPFLLGM